MGRCTQRDEEARGSSRRIAEAHAWRQLSAVNILGHCLDFVTRAASKILVAEELPASVSG